jgi:hypothetical protein
LRFHGRWKFRRDFGADDTVGRAVGRNQLNAVEVKARLRGIESAIVKRLKDLADKKLDGAVAFEGGQLKSGLAGSNPRLTQKLVVVAKRLPTKGW